MKTYNYLTKHILIALLSVFVLSCTTTIDWDKQIDELINGQSYVIPIGESTITLEEILQQFDTLTFLDADDNSIFVKYNDTITWNFREIADLQNLETLKDVYIPNTSLMPVLLQPNETSSKDFSHVINFGFNTDVADQRIDWSEMNSAKVEITVNTENLNVEASNIRLTTFFPSNVLVFAPSADIYKGVGSTFVFQPTVLGAPESVTLNPFTLYTSNNLATLNLIVRLEVMAGNTPIVINPESKLNLTYRIYDVDTKVYYGKFKPVIAIDAQEKTVDMTEYILEIPQRGVFKIAEPVITMDLLNNSGLKINFDIDSIKAFKENDPSFTPVYAKFGTSKSTSKVLDRIATFGGSPVKTTFMLDHTAENGNISHFFDRFPLPDRLMYKFRLSNGRVDSDPPDFMTPTGNITANIGVKVPLKLNAGSSFEFRDTLENIDMDNLINMQVVDQMLLILKVTNNLPLKGKLSLQFLDINQLPIEGLKVLSDSTINAPAIDDNGLVLPNSTAISDLKIVIESSQLPKLRLAKHLAYNIKVESEENRKIILQKENYIKLKLGKYSKGE